ncbi:MAG: NAD-dependent epimerase/dehydratase family protein, partial [Pseudomonadota bacterium]|nr:NAD-dependent epimerase/dehydratase family protein [Pseudomonadota bacterium]
SYADLHQLPATGMRFFTVYGPWGRPDMAPCLFAASLLRGEPIAIFNHGRMARDFTYIDDVVECIVRLLPHAPGLGPDRSAPHEIYNLGRGKPIALLDFVDTLEKRLGTTATRHFKQMQPGDVERTWADTRKLRSVIDYTPQVSLERGIDRFVAWLLDYRELMLEAMPT